MGNKQKNISKSSKDLVSISINDQISQFQKNEEKVSFINDYLSNTGYVLSDKEVNTMKMTINNLEQYYKTTFDYFILFNNYIFQEKVHQIYDNLNAKIEKCKGKVKLLIAFEEDNECDWSKVDLDSFFTVILEKLEIESYVYIDLSNMNEVFINTFYIQIIDSIDMYKYNRKYENLYILLPDCGFIIKHDSLLIYTSFIEYGYDATYKRMLDENYKTKPKEKQFEDFIGKDLYKINYSQTSDSIYNIIDIKGRYYIDLFTNPNIEKLVSCKYQRLLKTNEIDYFNKFIEESKLKYFKVIPKFSFHSKPPLSTKSNNPNKFLSKNIFKEGIDKGSKQNQAILNKINSDYKQMMQSMSLIDISFDKNLIYSLIEESNEETFKKLAFLFNSIPYGSIVINYININNELYSNTINFQALLIKIIDISNRSDLNNTMIHIKIIINLTHSLKEGMEKFDNLKQVFNTVVVKHLGRVIKKHNRIYLFDLIELCSINDSSTKKDMSGTGDEEINSEYKYKGVINRSIYKWNREVKRSTNFTYLLALLANKYKQYGLLEEEVIDRINGFLFVDISYNTVVDEVKLTEIEYKRFLY